MSNNAKTNVTFINGVTNQSFESAQAISKVDTLEGKVNPPSGATTLNVAGIVQVVEKVDVLTGRAKKIPNVNTSVSDRNYPMASGYTATGVPTYGDGIQAINTVYPTDNDIANKGNFTYTLANGPLNKNYKDLAT